jgi:hypothetical protein
MRKNLLIGCLFMIALACLTLIAARVSTAWAEDFEVEFMEFSIDKKIPINPSTGEFQVIGKVTCQETPYDEEGYARWFSVSGSLEQKVKGELITGSFSALFGCDPERSKWSTQVIADDGRFYPGRVSVNASGCASPTSSVFDCDRVATKVQLKKAKD